MDLLRWIAEELNIFGLMIYSAGMILMVGTLVLANYADDRRDTKSKARANNGRETLNTGGRCLNSGSLAILAAMRRASSRVRNLAGHSQ